ncbi:MAG: ribosomal protein [Crocinitomicaceae bacterium]|jgi:small subunit ribosomal protein S16|nr:ribosomal protein [Crocinitomicaceae bacterium]
MATRIRLQRHGKKGKAFFHLVVADSRAKRDGKFIEKLGVYNPNTNPATIDINFDRTLNWVGTGAEMTDTARAILSYKGVLYKNHLLNGVKKGALTEADVETKFSKWLADKDSKIDSKKDGLSKSAAQAKADALKAEEAAKEARAKAIEAKNTPEVEEAPAAEAEATEETAPEAETATEDAPEAVVEETATEEAPAAETATEEAPAVETPADEAPATEEAPASEEEKGTEEA